MVDEVEARRILNRRLAELRRQSFSDLKDAWLEQPDCEQIPGKAGVEYQIEIEALWEDRNAQHLRLVLSIDDGRGWRAFAPLTDSFIVAPDGSFVGED